MCKRRHPTADQAQLRKTWLRFWSTGSTKSYSNSFGTLDGGGQRIRMPRRPPEMLHPYWRFAQEITHESNGRLRTLPVRTEGAEIGGFGIRG